MPPRRRLIRPPELGHLPRTARGRRDARRHPGAALLLAALATLAVVAVACGSGGTPTRSTSAIVAVATTTQLGDIVSQVAGDRATVETMVRPNQDPHAYDPTPGDVTHVADSAVVFKNGAGLDDWLDRVLQNAGGSRPIVDLSQHVTLRKQGGETDPHYWMDPTNVEAMIPAIRDALTQVDPGGKDTYDANAVRYLAAVQAMDASNRALIDQVPTAERKMVTDHDAFRYYTEHYGITYVGSILQGFSTSQEPTTGQLSDLIKQIQVEGVKAIFTERSVNPRLAEELGKEAGVQVVSTLYGDSLGLPGSGADTYIGMMETNTRAIVAALKGEAPK